MKTKNSWTNPKVKTYPLETGKDWYVWFRYNGGNPIRVKLGLNKIPDYDEQLFSIIDKVTYIESDYYFLS